MEVANLIPNTGPLAQVLDHTKDLIAVISDKHDNKDDLEYLVQRVLRFLKGMTEMKFPLHDGTSMAAGLYALGL
jgi:hypothetical protein